jgi:hypothetical protein
LAPDQYRYIYKEIFTGTLDYYSAPDQYRYIPLREIVTGTVGRVMPARLIIGT